MIHKTALIDSGAKIGSDCHIWHFSHICSGANIGSRVTVGQNCFIGSNVKIGEGSKIQNNCQIFDGVRFGKNVFCGPSVVFTNVINPRAHIDRGNQFKPTLVSDHVTIGANATVICGTILGEFCFVGAGSVVTADVPAFALVVGNPARLLGWVDESANRLSFDDNGRSDCGKFVMINGTNTVERYSDSNF